MFQVKDRVVLCAAHRRTTAHLPGGLILGQAALGAKCPWSEAAGLRGLRADGTVWVVVSKQGSGSTYLCRGPLGAIGSVKLLRYFRIYRALQWSTLAVRSYRPAIALIDRACHAQCPLTLFHALTGPESETLQCDYKHTMPPISMTCLSNQAMICHDPYCPACWMPVSV